MNYVTMLFIREQGLESIMEKKENIPKNWTMIIHIRKGNVKTSKSPKIVYFENKLIA